MPSPASEPDPVPAVDADDVDARWQPRPWEQTPWWRQVLAALERAPGPVLVLVAIAVGALVVGAVVLWPRPTTSIDDAVPLVTGADESVAPPAPVTAPPSVTSPDVQVHVAGAVASPGVYRLPTGGRVADVVAAAGGLTADADPDRINLAAELSDGTQVFVPRVGEEAPAATAPGPDVDDGRTADGERTVDVNTAGPAELEELPGIGPTLAEAIVRHRETYGPFAALDDLTSVSGIGPAKLDALRDSARV